MLSYDIPRKRIHISKALDALGGGEVYCAMKSLFLNCRPLWAHVEFLPFKAIGGDFIMGNVQTEVWLEEMDGWKITGSIWVLYR